MSSRNTVINGWSRPNKIRLNEDNTKLNTSDPIQGMATGAVIRILKTCNTVDDIGNVASIAAHFQTYDGNAQQTPQTVGEKEVYHVEKGGKKTTVSSPESLKILTDQGWIVTDVETVDDMR